MRTFRNKSVGITRRQSCHVVADKEDSAAGQCSQACEPVNIKYSHEVTSRAPLNSKWIVLNYHTPQDMKYNGNKSSP